MLLKNLFLTLMAGSFLLAALVNGLRGQMANCVVGAVYGSVLIYVMWLMWRVPHVDMVRPSHNISASAPRSFPLDIQSI